MALTELQLQERMHYIGGSDASTICGVNPYGNIIELWQEKLGLKEIEDISDKPSIRAGNYLEPVVAQWFQDDTNKLVEIANKTFYHKTIPYMAANIDRRLTDEKAILECKTASRDDNWGADADNTIPDYYMCQLAHYCAVCDVDLAYIAVLIRGSDFRWYTYHRNQKLEDMIIKKEKEFWDCVKNEIPPVPRTPDEIISLYSQATDEEPLIIDEDIEEYLEQLIVNKQNLKSLDGAIKICETRIKAYMKNHDILHDRKGKPCVTWRNSKGAVRFNAKKFAEEHEKLYEQYLYTGKPTRTFRIK
jgi:putative phage-type endonuclease